MITCTQAIRDIVECLERPATLAELTLKLGGPPTALQRAISGGYVVRLRTDPIRYVRGRCAGDCAGVGQDASRRAG